MFMFMDAEREKASDGSLVLLLENKTQEKSEVYS